MSSINRRDIGFVVQPGFDQLPVNPALQLLRHTGSEGISIDRDFQDSAEIRADFAMVDGTPGFSKYGLQLPFSLSFGTYSELIAALLFNPLADGGAGQSVTDGIVPKFFLFEDRYNDIGTFISGKNYVANSMNLKVEPGKAITGSFEFVGGGGTVSAASVASSVLPQTVTPEIDSYTGSLSEGGAIMPAIMTSLDLSFNRGMTPGYAAFRDSPVQITSSKFQVSGTLGAYFTDRVLLNKFVNRQPSSLELTLQDPLGNRIICELPRILYTGGKRTNRDPDVLLSLPFKAVRDPMKGYTTKFTFTPVGFGEV